VIGGKEPRFEFAEPIQNSLRKLSMLVGDVGMKTEQNNKSAHDNQAAANRQRLNVPSNVSLTGGK
jgi:hypothetical protein